jgi:uncharacterized Zn finger protein (UPF0148 family)
MKGKEMQETIGYYQCKRCKQPLGEYVFVDNGYVLCEMCNRKIRQRRVAFGPKTRLTKKTVEARESLDRKAERRTNL